MTQIIWKLPDGEIAITTLVEASDPEKEAKRLVEAGLIAGDWQTDHIRDSDNHFEIADPDFFAALTTADGEIVIDMAKARAIWRDRIRQARAPLFAALDVAWQRADETGDTEGKAAVIAQKSALRDLPADPRIDCAGSLERLRTTWPDLLT